MKRFKQYVKEEVDLRKSKGIPTDFMRKSEEEASRSLGIRIDDESQMMRIWPEFERNMRESNQLLGTKEDGSRLSQRELRDRIKKLEELAEKVVRDQFDELLTTSVKPIELNIKLVPMGGVTSEIEEIEEVEAEPQEPSEEDQEDTEEREKEEEEKKKEEEGEGEEEQKPGTDLVSAVDKKKILNMITQAAGKSAKDIIRASDIVEDGLKEIFGNTWQRILNCWVRMSDIADKMDWVIPIERKAQMMKHQPGGMAGACDVKWESVTGNYYDIKLLLEKEASKIVISAVGVDFPMLIHETIKGIYIFLQSGAIKSDKKTAEIIKKATSSFLDEAQDFRYGPPALQMLLLFVNKFTESEKYKRLDTQVFTLLAVDKARAMDEIKSSPAEYREYFKRKAEIVKTDEEFLEIMKSIFSTFDLQGSNWVLNEERFNQSLAKTEIKKIIDFIVSEDERYAKELSDWEREQKEREEAQKYASQEPEGAEESDVDELIKKSQEPEPEESTEVDYSELTQKELHRLVDDALETGDFAKVKEISKYLKEGAEIYLKEIDRLNEMHNFHTRRK